MLVRLVLFKRQFMYTVSVLDRHTEIPLLDFAVLSSLVSSYQNQMCRFQKHLISIKAEVHVGVGIVIMPLL